MTDRLGRGGTRNGAGRPAVAPSDRLRNKLMMSFTDGQWDALLTASSRHGITPQQMLRDILMHAVRSMPPTTF